MDIPAKIRAGIAKARTLMDPSMVDVQQRRVIGRDRSGPVYADELIPRRGLVEAVGEPVFADDGTQRVAASKITFLEPIPIDELDIFMVNGKEMYIAKIAGLLDPDGQPYFSEVWLGRTRFR